MACSGHHIKRSTSHPAPQPHKLLDQKQTTKIYQIPNKASSLGENKTHTKKKQLRRGKKQPLEKKISGRKILSNILRLIKCIHKIRTRAVFVFKPGKQSIKNNGLQRWFSPKEHACLQACHLSLIHRKHNGRRVPTSTSYPLMATHGPYHSVCEVF